MYWPKSIGLANAWGISEWFGDFVGILVFGVAIQRITMQKMHQGISGPKNNIQNKG